MKRLFVVLLALFVTACSLGGTDLSRDKDRWQDAKIAHYRFELSVGCFCAFRSQMPVTVEVQDGDIISMIGNDGTSISLTDPLNEYILKYATIDRLFSELESESVQKADKLTVTYDST